jgi:hypothetical protein
MKQLLLLIVISFFTINLTAQACIPNEIYRDSAVGVYPKPYHAVNNPDGGITESACINAPYEFVLTFVIPESFLYQGSFEVQIDSIVIAEQGAVGGLPIGMTYACNPGDCVFIPEDTIACMVIIGTATNANTPGDYELTISTIIYGSLGQLDLDFPNPFIPGADGQFILELLAEGSPNCFVGTNDYLTKNISVHNSPNPFGSTTNIEVVSKVEETLQFRVFDMLGNLVHDQKVAIYQGSNNIEFDGTRLSNGIYTYTLSNKTAVLSQKMVISR